MNNMSEFDPKLEQLEKELTTLHEEYAPTKEFQGRMMKRLQRHAALLQERAEYEQSFKGKVMSFFTKRTYAVLTALVFVVSTGGLSTFAYSNDSVTNGTTLYPVKRGLEKVEEAVFATNPQSHAQFQVKMLGRRLAESHNLTMQGVVDEPTTQEVSALVDTNLAAIKRLEIRESRTQLFGKVQTLLQDEEKKFHDLAGDSIDQDDVPVPATSIADSASATITNTQTAQPLVTPLARPKNIHPKVFEAMRKSDRHLKEIEIRFKEVRGDD